MEISGARETEGDVIDTVEGDTVDIRLNIYKHYWL